MVSLIDYARQGVIGHTPRGVAGNPVFLETTAIKYLFSETTSCQKILSGYASSIELSGHLMAGVSLHVNTGAITSEIRGDNHGSETHKWPF